MLEGSLTIDAGVLTGDLNISEVRLGYVRVISKDLLQEDSNVTTENGVEVLYRRSGACLEVLSGQPRALWRRPTAWKKGGESAT